MRLQACLLAVLALSMLAQADSIGGPKQVGAAQLTLVQNWTLDFGNNVPSFFTLQTFGFPSTWAQHPLVQSAGSTPVDQQTDGFGNTLIIFKLAPKNEFETVSLTASIATDYSAVIPPGPQPAGEYLSVSNLTWFDAAMASAAQAAVANASSDVEKIVVLTNFVHNYVTYDGLGYGNTTDNASFVFAHQHGTCDEFSHLEIAFLRSLKIPAKFDAGFVCSANCSQSENWGLHAWVEAYVNGKWYPLDPTFDEALVLDGTHVKFAEGPDQSNMKEQYTGPPNYPIGDVLSRMQRSASVTVDHSTPPSPQYSIDVQQTNHTAGENSLETISITVSNPTNSPQAIPLSLAVPKELSLRDPADTLVFLPPATSKQVNWSVLTPPQLQENYVYKYSLNLESLGFNATIPITARKGGDTISAEKLQVIELKPEWSADGSQFSLTFLIQNSGNKGALVKAGLNVPSGTQEQTFPLQQGGFRSVTFSFPRESLPGAVLDGSLDLQVDSSHITQPFSITLHEQGAPLPENKQIVAGGAGFGDFAVYGVGAIIIILALALVVLRRH